MRIIATSLPLRALAGRARALEVAVESRQARQGEVLRVEVRGLGDPADAVLSFRGRDCPLYAAASDRLEREY